MFVCSDYTAPFGVGLGRKVIVRGKPHSGNPVYQDLASSRPDIATTEPLTRDIFRGCLKPFPCGQDGWYLLHV
jgi:hypothetical protein